MSGGGGVNTTEILDRLVAFPTVSRDPNLSLIGYVRDFLLARGIESKLYQDSTGLKANLYASVGPTDRGGVLLSGHTDVVPVDGQSWSSDPFTLKQRDGRLFARGSADMKGFIACALRAADIAAGMPLREPLQLAFSYDEEVGCVGVRSLVADMESWAHKPRFCVVGEPTLLRTAVGHKGKAALRAVCHGHAAHSANPDRGVNAIYMATDLIARVRQKQLHIASNSARDPAYEIPYTTLHVGVIRGGTALNIVPAHCEVELEIRNIVEDDPTVLIAGLRADAAAVAKAAATVPGGGIEIEITHEYPCLDTPGDAAVVEFVAALTGHQERIKVGFGSEAGLFSGGLGIPTVVCGPGSIEQAHKPDEYITVDQLQRCDAMMDALLRRLA
jgi:acetylornithine deacetylase